MIAVETNKACDLILFGTQGDLACRKLLPALYQLEKSGLLHPDTHIIGVARDNLTCDAYVLWVKENLEKYVKEPFDNESWHRLQQKLYYVQTDLSQTCDYEKLTAVTHPEKRITVSYFAIPPSLYGQVSQGLFTVGLATWPARVVLEKPIGHDLVSSICINNQVSRYFTENQIYRIDHYLGKETVLNLLVLRFANMIFASNWDNRSIDYIQISVAEEVGIEGRWGYYDDAGQMRDMVQNHLLQILSLIAMEPPVNMEADSIRDEKLKVLRALRPISLTNVKTNTIRGQYVKGVVNGQVVPSYLDEPDAREHSQTETFVALKVEIDNWRWAGIPFYLRTGKRMAKKNSEVVICFKPLPHYLFQEIANESVANKLVVRLQPDEGVDIQIMHKVPGLHQQMQIEKTKLDLSFDKAFKSQRIADAYERLLLEILMGNQYLFVRRDEVEQAWKWVDGIINAWHHLGEPPHAYQAGTSGPIEAQALLATSHHWE